MKRFVIGLAVVLLSVGTSKADFISYGSDDIEVYTHHAVGILYDSSTASVVPGGRVDSLYVNDTSTAIIDGGSIGTINSYAYGTVEMLGGIIDELKSDSTDIDISGGDVDFLYAEGLGNICISGNGDVFSFQAHGNNAIEISGGSALIVSLFDFCSLDMSSGKAGAIYAYSSGSITISGGSITNIQAHPNSHPTLYGFDFRATAGLSLSGDTVTGTGILTGRWKPDGETWMINIKTYTNSAIQLVTVPEPGIIILLIGGIAVLLSRRQYLIHEGYPS